MEDRLTSLNSRRRVARLLAGAAVVGGFWLFWGVRCYQLYEGKRLQPLVRNIAWGGLPTVYLAVVLLIAARRFDAAESPDEPGWKKWVRLVTWLVWAGVGAVVSWVLYSLRDFSL